MLTDDQILLADLLLTKMKRQDRIYLHSLYSSMGAVISTTYSGDSNAMSRLLIVYRDTNVTDLIEFLLEQGYIAQTELQGQFAITPVGTIVKERGGHKIHRELEEVKTRQEIAAAKPPKKHWLLNAWEYIGRHNLLSAIVYVSIGFFASHIVGWLTQLYKWIIGLTHH